jgi:DNA-binding GntR family transcriptional regulator
VAARSSVSYLTVAERLRVRVESAVYRQGTDLPPASVLAAEFHVGTATVCRALHELDKRASQEGAGMTASRARSEASGGGEPS